MIEVIDYTIDEDMSLFIAWDRDGDPQEDITISRKQWCDLLMDLGYIADFHNEGHVAVEVDGQKYWMSFDQWVADDMCDRVALDLLQHMKKASTTGGL